MDSSKMQRDLPPQNLEVVLEEDLSGRNHDLLGEPLSIWEVARMIGCSAWTVRNRLLRLGLPHFRSGPSGRLIFYRDQVVRWILQKQQERRNAK